ncbi:MAG: hypothetical protein FWC26_02155 [Fibromonadales bacterium]|nr:hypothetical protein [Fibromonadales bacterium]
MAKAEKIDYDYYDSHDFGDEMLEAKKKGELHTVAELGCSDAFEAGRKFLSMKTAKNKNENFIVINLTPKIRKRAESLDVSLGMGYQNVLKAAMLLGIKELESKATVAMNPD